MSRTERMGDGRKADRLDPQLRRIARVKIPTSRRGIQILQPVMRAVPALGSKGVRVRRTLIGGKDENRIPVFIFTPEGKASPGPCLVYFHGGAFRTEHYGAELWQSLARRGVITVCAEYRAGALGFMAHADLAKEDPDGHTGNYGILDQIYAL